MMCDGLGPHLSSKWLVLDEGEMLAPGYSIYSGRSELSDVLAESEGIHEANYGRNTDFLGCLAF